MSYRLPKGIGLSIRQTTAMAPRMGGRKVGGRWMLNTDLVVEEARARFAMTAAA